MLRRLLLCAALAFALGACGGTEDDPGPDDDPIAEPDAGAASGDELDFMQSCDPVDDLCGDGLVCFNFNSRGPHCTHDCTTAADCPDPSPGCNNMGVCKAP